MPLFSIIVVHFQGTIPHEIFCRGIASLQAQTFRDFEIRCYHDGPLIDTSVELPVPVICTEKRFKDWGHSLRDRGIREAAGDYIVHFNADNILYPFALEKIAEQIRRQAFTSEEHQLSDPNDIVIFPIILHGAIRFTNRWLHVFRDMGTRERNLDYQEISIGVPPVVYEIDCMQLVMKRELWLKEGGWYNKSEAGDGEMYELFAQKYGYRHVGPVLGEHF